MNRLKSLPPPKKNIASTTRLLFLRDSFATRHTRPPFRRRDQIASDNERITRARYSNAVCPGGSSGVLPCDRNLYGYSRKTDNDIAQFVSAAARSNNHRGRVSYTVNSPMTFVTGRVTVVRGACSMTTRSVSGRVPPCKRTHARERKNLRERSYEKRRISKDQ